MPVTESCCGRAKAANTDVGETFTMAPLIYDDLILIGPAGSENAVSGWVGAFRLDNGEPVWRFETVPGARDPGDDSWGNPEDIVLGGGAVWTPFSFDPDREELYVAVTNPLQIFPPIFDRKTISTRTLWSPWIFVVGSSAGIGKPCRATSTIGT